MSYEHAILIRNQGTVRVKAERETISMTVVSGAQETTLNLLPEQAEQLQKALDTALCYYGDVWKG